MRRLDSSFTACNLKVEIEHKSHFKENYARKFISSPLMQAYIEYHNITSVVFERPLTRSFYTRGMLLSNDNANYTVERLNTTTTFENGMPITMVFSLLTKHYMYSLTEDSNTKIKLAKSQ